MQVINKNLINILFYEMKKKFFDLDNKLTPQEPPEAQVILTGIMYVSKFWFYKGNL